MNWEELKDVDIIIDYVVELIGRKWTKSMIKRELREYFPELKSNICIALISKAKKRICEIYGIDPSVYKGYQISFYESVIRGNAKVRDKLTAAERLDKLFGLEQITSDDPAIIAVKIQQALKEMDKSVIGGNDNGGSENGGNSKVDTQVTDNKAEKDTVFTESEVPVSTEVVATSSEETSTLTDEELVAGIDFKTGGKKRKIKREE